MVGGTSSLGSGRIFVCSSYPSIFFSSCLCPFDRESWEILSNSQTVIALVEYLTSEQAGEELGASFAWPVGAILQKDLGSSTTEGTGSVKINVVEEVVAERQSLHSVAERQPLLIASGGRKQL